MTHYDNMEYDILWQYYTRTAKSLFFMGKFFVRILCDSFRYQQMKYPGNAHAYKNWNSNTQNVWNVQIQKQQNYFQVKKREDLKQCVKELE